MSTNKAANSGNLEEVDKFNNGDNVSDDSHIRTSSFIAVANGLSERIILDMIGEEFNLDSLNAKALYVHMTDKINDMKNKGLTVAQMSNWAKDNFSSGQPPLYRDLAIPVAKGLKKKKSRKQRMQTDDIEDESNLILNSPICLNTSSSPPGSTLLPSSSVSSSFPSHSSTSATSALILDGVRDQIRPGKKRKRIPQEEEDEEDGVQMSAKRTIDIPEDENGDDDLGAFIRDNDDTLDQEREDSSSNSEVVSELEDDSSQPYFPAMLARSRMSLPEKRVLRKLSNYTSHIIRGPWENLDILNEMLDPKMRRKLEVNAQASRTFYPAPKQFIRPLKGRTANTISDTAWYRTQSDVNIMYRFIMWSLLKLEEGNVALASRAIMTVVIPLIYHLLSRCQRERINLRYPRKVVNALYEADSEPMIRPGHLEKAKQLAAQQKDLRTITNSFFGQGSRGRGSPFHPRGSFLGSRRGIRYGWQTRRGRFPQQQQQQQQQRQRQRGFLPSQQEKLQFTPKFQKN
jgi:hypothetical protein